MKVNCSQCGEPLHPKLLEHAEERIEENGDALVPCVRCTSLNIIEKDNLNPSEYKAIYLPQSEMEKFLESKDPLYTMIFKLLMALMEEIALDHTDN